MQIVDRETGATRKVRTWYNFSPDSDGAGEKHGGISLTIPDQTLPMKELLARYTRGQQITTFTPVYNGDNDLPDVSRMTELEMLELKMGINEHIRETRDALITRSKERKAQKDAQSQGEQSSDK